MDEAAECCEGRVWSDEGGSSWVSIAPFHCLPSCESCGAESEASGLNPFAWQDTVQEAESAIPEWVGLVDAGLGEHLCEPGHVDEGRNDEHGAAGGEQNH